jgi:broad specificity phosphatase PhoE
MTTKILLIRHGETRVSARKIYYGARDVALNRTGIAQAKRLARRLKKETIHAVYVSDLSRARRFAARALQGHRIISTPRLREINFGAFEGFTHEALVKRHPKLYARWLKNPFQCAIPQGDVLARFRKRIKAYVRGLVRAHRGNTIALVTHAGPIKILMRDILKIKDIWTIPIDLASISVVEVQGNKITAVLVNDTSHLTKRRQVWAR